MKVCRFLGLVHPRVECVEKSEKIGRRRPRGQTLLDPADGGRILIAPGGNPSQAERCCRIRRIDSERAAKFLLGLLRSPPLQVEIPKPVVHLVGAGIGAQPVAVEGDGTVGHAEAEIENCPVVVPADVGRVARDQKAAHGCGVCIFACQEIGLPQFIVPQVIVGHKGEIPFELIDGLVVFTLLEVIPGEIEVGAAVPGRSFNSVLPKGLAVPPDREPCEREQTERDKQCGPRCVDRRRLPP